MLNLIQDRFGKVFVPKPGPGGKTYHVLEGAKFSNLNFQVTNEKSQEEIYKGHSFHVEVLGVRLKIPIPLGMNIKPNIQAVQQAVLKEIDTAKNLKIFGNNEKSDLLEREIEKFRNSNGGFYYALNFLDCDWMDHEFPRVALFYTQLDDMLESFGNHEESDVRCKENNRRKCNYSLVSGIANIMADLLQTATSETFGKLLGDPLQLLQIACVENSSLKIVLANYKQHHLDDLRAVLQSLLNAVSSIRSAAISMGIKNNCSAEGFLYQSGRIIKANGLQLSREWNNEIMSNKNAKLMLPTMLALRQISSAGNYTMESAFLIEGIHLKNKIRDSALFKLIYDKSCSNTQKVNDIFSCEKEMHGTGDEWRNNEAGVLHTLLGMSKSAALAQVAEGANLDWDQVEILSKLLIDEWKDTEDEQHVTNFVDALKRHVSSHIRWSSVRDRYHKNLVMDCYIDEI